MGIMAYRRNARRISATPGVAVPAVLKRHYDNLSRKSK